MIVNCVSCLHVGVTVQSPCNVMLYLIMNVLSDFYLYCVTVRFIILSNESM